MSARFAALVDVAAGSGVVFGSQQHKWRVDPPLTEPALAKLEQKLGAAIPDEARAWLSTVSGGGAGPDYGVDVGVSADGCLTLTDEGCGMHSVLVVSGRSRGQVMTVENNRRRKNAPSFFAWIDQWLRSATTEWAAERAWPALAAKKPLPFLRDIVDDVAAKARAADDKAVAEGRVGKRGSGAPEEWWLTLCWAACAAADFDGAIVYGDRAAAAFYDVNAGFEPRHLFAQERERAARRHLTRARVHTLAGRFAEAAVDVEAGLALVSHEGKRVVWHSTIDALTALQTQKK